MFSKKLDPQLQEKLQQLEIIEPTEIQQLVFSKLVAGGDHIITAENGSGKTTMMIIFLLHKLKAAFEDAPRAMVLVPDKEAALALKERFIEVAGRTDLRFVCAYERGPLDIQRDDIYGGVDVVIATPKRIQEIYFQNGVNLNKMKHFVVDSGETLTGNIQVSVDRMFQSIPDKCQRIMISDRLTERLELLAADHMPDAMFHEA